MPGTAKRTTVPLPSASPLPTGAGPSPVILIKVTFGMRSPTDSVIASPGSRCRHQHAPALLRNQGQQRVWGGPAWSRRPWAAGQGSVAAARTSRTELLVLRPYRRTSSPAQVVADLDG